MDIHLVGGFLGSGKTTAIASAIKWLQPQGKRVGVITNDRGKHLVDTALFQGKGVPTKEIAGGCFRCSFSELNELLQQLQGKYPLWVCEPTNPQDNTCLHTSAPWAIISLDWFNLGD